jgi:hypothetical protein
MAAAWQLMAAAWQLMAAAWQLMVWGFKRHISAYPCLSVSLSVRLPSGNNCITAARNAVGLDI